MTTQSTPSTALKPTNGFNTPIQTPRKRRVVHTGLSNPIESPGFGRGVNGGYGFATGRGNGLAKTKSKRRALGDLIQEDKFAGQYNPAVDMQPSYRPGSMDAFSKPSRVGDTLFFRDGSTKHSPIQHHPKTVFLAP